MEVPILSLILPSLLTGDRAGVICPNVDVLCDESRPQKSESMPSGLREKILGGRVRPKEDMTRLLGGGENIPATGGRNVSVIRPIDYTGTEEVTIFPLLHRFFHSTTTTTRSRYNHGFHLPLDLWLVMP